jgi:hypothetical protein
MVAASSSLARHVYQASWALRNVGFAVGLINGWSDRILNYLANAKYTSTPLDPRHRAERASPAIATPPHQRPHDALCGREDGALRGVLGLTQIRPHQVEFGYEGPEVDVAQLLTFRHSDLAGIALWAMWLVGGSNA